MNGEDRWPNVLSRRLQAAGHRAAVINAGIGGNQVAGPADYSPQKPFPGGPSAGARLERDVLSLSGVRAVIWLEGINDFSRNGNASVDIVTGRMREIVRACARASRHQGVRRHGRDRARRDHPITALPSRTTSAGAQPVHPHVGPVRRRRRLRCRDARPGDRRAEGGVRARQHDRRPGRQAASEPRRLSGDGQLHRPRHGGGQAEARARPARRRKSRSARDRIDRRHIQQRSWIRSSPFQRSMEIEPAA